MAKKNASKKADEKPEPVTEVAPGQAPDESTEAAPEEPKGHQPIKRPEFSKTGLDADYGETISAKVLVPFCPCWQRSPGNVGESIEVPKKFADSLASAGLIEFE